MVAQVLSLAEDFWEEVSTLKDQEFRETNRFSPVRFAQARSPNPAPDNTLVLRFEARSPGRTDLLLREEAKISEKSRYSRFLRI